MICPKCGEKVKRVDINYGDCKGCGKRYTITECFSRVVGYIRPVESWHNGKQAEFKDRELFGDLNGGTNRVEGSERVQTVLR